ncbi:MAG: SDR family oxidoreductase [Alphaproteobacteria bacterium]|nr:SDR family oxidoreductase [Alphaproteobacteria bacterium]
MARMLDGRKALITGGAGGLGEAQAAALISDGADVLLLDNRADGLAEVAARLGTDYLVADLADPAGCVVALGQKADELDILVNNAAINPLKPIEAYDLAEFTRVQTVNATAAFALVQAVIPGMKRRGRGAILNICSVTLSGWWEDMVPYIASKGTLLGMTRAMARELGPAGIRVNAISPGAIPTPLEREVWAAKLAEYEAYLLDRQALKFRGSAEDIAQAALFLASDRGRFITGQNLVVDGGWWMQ